LGLSNRFIAAQIGCPESLLRRLLKALNAPAADIAAARQGKISTNELIRRAEDAARRKQKKQLENREAERQQKVIEATKAIRAWLKQVHLDGTYGENVALEARSLLITGCESGRLPPANQNVQHTAAEWIEMCRPKAPAGDDIHPIAWHAYWLALWSFYYSRDPHIAIDALAKIANV
jgi:hypothetical protein